MNQPVGEFLGHPDGLRLLITGVAEERVQPLPLGLRLGEGVSHHDGAVTRKPGTVVLVPDLQAEGRTPTVILFQALTKGSVAMNHLEAFLFGQGASVSAPAVLR